jgi:hypothetical protein
VYVNYEFRADLPRLSEFTEHMRAARSLVEQGRFANVFPGGTGPSAHVAPLYPLLLAVVYWLCGAGTEKSIIIQRVVASAGAALCAAICPLIARRAGLSVRVGLAAGALMALMPLNLSIETAGGHEQPFDGFVLLLLLGMSLGLLEAGLPGWSKVGLNSVVLGLAALLHPPIAFAGGAMSVVQVAKSCASGARKLALIGLLLGGGCAIVAPWVFRNYSVFGAFIPIRSNFGLELWIGNHPGSDGTTYSKVSGPRYAFFNANHPYNSKVEQQELAELGEREYMRQRMDRAVRWIEANPDQFATLTLSRLEMLWFPPTKLWIDGGSVRSPTVCLFSFFGLCGLVSLFWSRHAERWLFGIAALLPGIPYIVTHVDLRYRYPTWIMSVLLASIFLDTSVRALRSRTSNKPTPDLGARIGSFADRQIGRAPRP